MPAPAAMLRVLKGPNPGHQYLLERDKMVLGRHPDCDIVLDVGAVSRQHAQVLRQGEAYVVEDLNSRNGTFVNGQQVTGQHRLGENDRVKICDLLFTFHVDGAGSSTTAPATSSTTAPLSGPTTLNAPAPAGPTGQTSGFDLRKASIEDDGAGAPGSQIMSKLDMSGSHTGIIGAVNPEVKLNALFEITRSLSSALALDQVLEKMLTSLFRIFIQADRGFVILREGEGGPLVPRAVKMRRPGDEDRVRISRTVINHVLQSKEAILSADAASDSRFDSSQSIADFRIRSMMCAPLLSSAGQPLGVIQIDTLDQRSRFQQEDLDVLASVAVQAGFALENVSLHEQAMKRKSLERDLELAHRVQQGLLPKHPPEVPGYSFFNFYEPANEVGGDYIGYLHLTDGRIAALLADVAGKGISAALLMAKLSSDARFCLATEPTPVEAMKRLNRLFGESGAEDRFVTMAMLIIDPRTHHVWLVNAGHMAPYIRHADRSIVTIGEAEAGLPLGVFEDYEYECTEFDLAPGDSITVFTDGFSEAMNEKNDLFGLDRLQAQLATPQPSCKEIGVQLLSVVKKWAGKRAQSDDMALIVAGREV